MPKEWDLDGYFKIDVQPQGVFLTIYAPMGNGESVTLREVMEQIEAREIVGVDTELVELAIQEASGEPVKIGEEQPAEKRKAKSELFIIEISEDEMSAFLTVIPPRSIEEEITVEDIKEELKREGIVYGIDEDVIKDVVIREEYNKVVQVAKGTPPVPGDDAIIDFRFEKSRKRARLTEDKTGRVDYKELQLIQTVEPGDILAVKIPATKGTPGHTVLGNKIPAKDGEDVPLPAGKNTEITPDGLKVVSLLRGYVIWTGSAIEVEDTFEVKGDVGFETGNIDFPGNIIIGGNICDGFKVKSGSNIDVRGTIEQAFVEAKGDITVQNGIVGKGGGEVKAKGDIRAKFIENGNVRAGGDVIVSEVIMHSKVDAGGRVLLVGGKRGVILGGRVRAREEINARVFGSPAEVATELEVGIDPRLREEVLNLEETVEADKKNFKELKLGIKTLIEQKNRLGGKLPPDKEELLQKYFKAQNLLMEKLRDITERIAVLNRELSMQTGGKISVFNIAYRGVKISVCTTTLYLRREYKYSTFTLKAGRMHVQSYEEPVLKKKEKSPMK